MEHVLTETANFLLRQSWQIPVVFALVATACWALGKASAHWRYLLWLVVLAKCLVPPLVIVPLAVLPQAQTRTVESAPRPAAAPVLPETVLPEVNTHLSPAAPAELPVRSPAGQSAPEPVQPAGTAAKGGSRAAPSLTYAQWAAVGWIAGAGAFLLFALAKAVWIQRRLKRVREPVGAALRGEVEQLAGRLGLPCAPRVWLWDGIGQPFVWGLLRGSIYLPGDFAKARPGERRRGVLAHELAHVARWDAAVNALQVIVQGVFFFHPLVWWANRRVRQEREKCCDEIAIAALAAAPSDYGSAIVDALLARRESTRLVPSLAVTGPVKNIEDRIKTILSPKRKFRRRPTWLAILSVLLLAALAVPTALILTARAPEPASRVHWGQAVKGLQAGLSVRRVAAWPEAAVTLGFHLRNIGDKPVRIRALRIQKLFWGHLLPLEVKLAGKALGYRGPVLTPPPPPPGGGYAELAPGKSWSVEAVFLPKHWGRVDPTGLEIIYRFANRQARDEVPGYYSVGGLWTGQLRSGVVVLSGKLLASVRAVDAQATPDMKRAAAIAAEIKPLMSGIFERFQRGHTNAAIRLTRQMKDRLEAFQQAIRGSGQEAGLATSVQAAYDLEDALRQADKQRVRRLLERVNAVGPILDRALRDAAEADTGPSSPKPTTPPATQGAIEADRAAVTETALRFLKAVRDEDLDAMKSLSAGAVQGWGPGRKTMMRAYHEGEPPIGWSVECLELAAREIRNEVLASNPGLAEKVFQTAITGNFAGTMSPPVKQGSSRYLMLVFIRTAQGWRFATISTGDAGKPLGEELAKHAERIPANLKRIRDLLAQPAGGGKWDIRLENVDIRAALRHLAKQCNRSIVPLIVKGSVSVDLHDVTFTEALEAIVRTAGYTWVEKNSVIFVGKAESIRQLAPAQPATQPVEKAGPAELARLWGQIGSADFRAAYAAVDKLAAAGDAAVSLLAGKIEPVLVKGGPKGVRQLIQQSDDDRYRIRSLATEQIGMLGRWALPHLLAGLREAKTEEARTRLRRLIRAADSLLPDDDGARRMVRAVRVLELIDSDRGRGLLKKIESSPARPYVRYFRAGKHAVEAGFLPDQGEYVWGEPIQYFTLVVKNVGELPLSFTEGGDYRGGRSESNKITAVNGSGKAVPVPRMPTMGGRGSSVMLPPGGVYTKMLPASRRLTFSGPGVYTVTGSRTLRGQVKLPIVTSFRLTIHPYGKARMREAVDNLATRIRLAGPIRPTPAEYTEPTALTDALRLYINLTALTAIKDDAVVPHLVAMAAKGEQVQRAAALQFLGRFTTPEATAAALKAFRDENPAIRAAASGALGSMKTPAAVGALLAALPKERGDVAAAIIRAMGVSRSARVLKSLSAALDGEDADLRRAAIRAFTHFGGPEAIKALKRAAVGDNFDIREQAVRALVEPLKHPLDAQWLVPVIRSRRRTSALGDAPRLLRLYAGPMAVPALLSCLDFEDPSVRDYYNSAIIRAQACCIGGLRIPWISDRNRNGTPEEIERNRRGLRIIKAWVAHYYRHRLNEKPAPRHRNWREENRTWGEPVDGISIRISVNQRVWPEGMPQLVKIEVRGHPGQGSVNLSSVPDPLEVEVNGQWYSRQPPLEGPVMGVDAGHGSSFHNLELNEKWRRKSDNRRLQLAPRKYALRLRLSTTPRNRRTGLAASKPIQFEVIPTGLSTARQISAPARTGASSTGASTQAVGWGPAKNGVQARLRADRLIWQQGQVPTFKADIRNYGKARFRVVRSQKGCVLVLDGKSYQWPGWEFVSMSPFLPGTVYRDIRISLTGLWGGQAGLPLRPGRHKLAVRFSCAPVGDAPKPVVVQTNAVEFEIRPPAAQPAEARAGPGRAEEDRIARLIEQLGVDKASLREAAERKLIEIGEPAAAALRAAAKSKDPEIAARAERAWAAIQPARVTLHHDRQAYLLGENIIIHYRVENVAASPIPYHLGGFYPTLRRNSAYEITAAPVDESGKVIGEPLETIPPPAYHGGIFPVGGWKLAPGSIHQQTLYVPRYVRLTRPGRFRIRVANVDPGDRKREFAAAETMLTLKLPTPAQARAVYERMKKLPRGPMAASGERRDQEISDFEALIRPVYLPILLEHARKGDGDALTGLGKMHTVQSTEALVSLVEQGLRDDDLKLAVSAYGQMGGRLPNPRFYQNEKTRPANYKWYAPQRAFVGRTWRAEFAGPLRRLASRLARHRDSRNLREISFIFECVGESEDMPDLMLAYTKSIEATRTLPFETHQYFRPRGSAYGYRFSTRQLLARGAEVPVEPKAPGEAAAYLIAMQMRKDFRPEGWPEVVLRWLKYETPYMREFVLEHMPEPIPASVLEMLPRLLAHDYVDLQIAACHTARRHPRKVFVEPILKILRSETEKHLLNAATKAAGANGVTSDQIMDIWVNRIEGGLSGKAVARLFSVVDEDEAGWKRKLDPAEERAAKVAWARFIDAHREKIKAGRRFKAGDPELTVDLFPLNFLFWVNGKPWRLAKAP